MLLSPPARSVSSPSALSRCSSISGTVDNDALRTEAGWSAAPSGFQLSSAFDQQPASVRATVHNPLIWESSQLTSPRRWREGGTPKSSSLHLAAITGGNDDAPHRSSSASAKDTSVALASCTMASSASIVPSVGPLGASYMKVYDYSQPQVATKLHTSPKSVSFAVASDDSDAEASRMEVPCEGRRGFQPIGRRVLLKPNRASGQRRRAETEALAAAKGSTSPRALLYEGLPYTWRQLVPFECPVRFPELMSYDATCYHSTVARQCRDSGMRLLDLKKAAAAAGKPFGPLEGLDLNAERGVTGLSLRKHSVAYRMQDASTYPGIAMHGLQLTS